jgi:hypothetical protein
VGVDVVDRLRTDSRARHRHAHGALGTLATLGRRRHVERVGGRAIAGHLCDRARASRPCVLQLLDDQHRRSLRDDEAIARRVERTGCHGRVVGAGVGILGSAERSHLAEAGEGQRHQRRLGPGAEHDVGLAAHDRFHRLADGVAAGRTGADDGHVRSADPVLDGDLPRRGVGEHVWQHERADAPRPALEERLVAVEDHADAADGGADHHPEAVHFDVAVHEPVLAEQAGMTERLPGRRHGEMRVAVVASRVLGVHVGGCIEALDLARDVGIERRRVEQRDIGDPRAPGHERVPGCLGADADRRDDAQPGDDGPALRHAGISRRVAMKEPASDPSSVCVSASG